MGFPGGTRGKELACLCKRLERGFEGSIPKSGRFPWRRAWQPTPIFLPGESHGQRSLVANSPCGCKELDTLKQATSHVGTHALNPISVL